MKKRLLFVIDSLICAGAEKSLVSLLNQLDYSKYEVDLQLFAYGGELEMYVPKEVNVLPYLPYMDFSRKSLKEQFLFSVRKNWSFFWARWKYSYALRHSGKLNNVAIARIFWKTLSSCFFPSSVEYDYAVAYAQGVPTFYVADKVSAKKKFAWVNVSYNLQNEEKNFQSQFYKQMNGIVMVSESALDVFRSVYPEFAHKMYMIRDIVDSSMIFSLSGKGNSFNDGYKGLRILTVARLNKHQKGYDIALEACRILKDRGLHFRWYAIGRGPYKAEMQEFIRIHQLESHFVFLGTTSNPYSYFKDADLYVQTSRHEGFGLSIAEARLLNTPVVTTEFDAVYNQMVPGENGLVVPQDPILVADAIECILSDKSLYNHIVSYLKQEKKGNPEEVEKFYHLIEG